MNHIEMLPCSSVVHAEEVIVAITRLRSNDPDRLRAISFLPDWVHEQVCDATEKRRVEFLTGRWLLAEVLQRYGFHAELPRMQQTRNQKPIFCDPTLPHFNISHSGDHIAVAVCGSGHIGLDIERHRPQRNQHKIARLFFSEHENNWLAAQPDGDLAFWRLWTLREAALKLYGKGVWQMKQVQMMPETSYVVAEFGSDFHCHYHRIGDLHISLCGQCTIPQVHLTSL